MRAAEAAAGRCAETPSAIADPRAARDRDMADEDAILDCGAEPG